jgi:predicted oxidoreductase
MSLLPAPPPTRTLGRSGIAVSSLAWGMWRFAGDVGEATALVHSVLNAGITLFDTADIYGFNGTDGFGDAEALLGRVFASEPGLRDRMVLATKGGIMPPLPYDSSFDYLTGALDASLARLGVEAVDLYQIHRPDVLTHPAELVRFAEAAYAAGKIRAFGISNFHPAQTRALLRLMEGASLPLSTTQPEISPLAIEAIEDRDLAIAMEHELTPLAWSPLAGGRIADPVSGRDQAVAAALDVVAKDAGVSRSAAAYSWLMAHPAGIIPIVGTQKAERVAEAMDAYAVRWSRQSWYSVLVAARGVPLP